MKFPYEDILNEKRPAPLRPRMSNLERAAQFSPFAALVGYDEVIEESARLTDKRKELTENEKQELDNTLDILRSLIDQKPLVLVRVFVPDEKKAGGKSVLLRKRLKKIDETRRLLVFEDKDYVRMEDIEDLSLEQITSPD